MCAIAGIFSYYASDKQDIYLEKMCTVMKHRGPDDRGFWHSDDGRLSFGHNRLAIIDLSVMGHQPMADNSKQYIITFNGEIYNYKSLRFKLEKLGHSFLTNSDTEVILESYKEWNEDCVKYLRGAFAFCIYNNKEQTIFLARDISGEKPLYYLKNDKQFVFASELKGLMSNPSLTKKVNPEALNYYLTYGYIRGDQSILSGINKLQPGYALTISLLTNKMNLMQYWQIPKVDPKIELYSIDQLSNELYCHLESAVQSQMVADVPVGILLSGGLDSSIITGIASRSSTKKVKTFTVSFPDYKKIDEGPYARIVSKHFDTDHTELIAESPSLETLHILAKQFDEPLADSSVIPTYLVSKLLREHCTVALGGDGGDELFGGYPTYNRILKQNKIRNFFPSVFRGLSVDFMEALFPLGMKGRNEILALKGDISNASSSYNVFFNNKEQSKLIPTLFHTMNLGAYNAIKNKSSLYNIEKGLPGMLMEIDFLSYLPEDILIKVDRASMANSLEVRAPFLDKNVIEFAFSKVSNKYRTNVKDRKILLKKMASSFLPINLDVNRKQGFVLPMKEWIKGDFGEYMKDILYNSECMIYNKKELKKLFESSSILNNNSQRIFALFMFELWRKEYNVSVF